MPEHCQALSFKEIYFYFCEMAPKQGCRHIGLCSDCDMLLCVEAAFFLLRSYCVREKYETTFVSERPVIGGFVPLNVQKQVLVPHKLLVCISMYMSMMIFANASPLIFCDVLKEKDPTFIFLNSNSNYN